jgi:hypothetical protein
MGLAMIVLAGAASLARAQDAEAAAKPQPSLDEAMKQLAERLKTTLDGQSEDSIVVQAFTGPPGTSAGPAIVKSLKSQLDGAKLKVVDAGSWGVSGTYRGAKNEESGKFEIAIRAVLTDQTGEERFKLQKQIFTDEAEGLAILGTTVETPLKVTKEQVDDAKSLEEVRADAVIASVVKPNVALTGPSSTGIRPNPESPFGLEILLRVGDRFEPLPPRVANGVAFVDIAPDQIYAVRIINDAEFDAGVALSIDGINMFAFSQVPHYKELGKVVVPAKSAGIIKGWHDAGDNSFAFQISKIADSAAAKFGNLEGIGTINATFCAAFEGPPPADEPPGGKGPLDGLATKLGPPVQQLLKEVPRKFGVVRSSISVRYTKPDLSDAPPAELQ